MIKTRVEKLEDAKRRAQMTGNTIFIRQIKCDLWEVFNPESTGRIKVMTTQELEKRPRDHGYLFLLADGGVQFEEPE